MLAKKQTLRELCRGLTIYPQVLKNVRVRDKAEALEDPKVRSAIEEATRALGDTGRILVRESGTEPVIRVMAEAASMEECENFVNRIVESLSAHCTKI